MYIKNNYVKKMSINNIVWRVDSIQGDNIYLSDIKDGSSLIANEEDLELASNLDITLYMLGIEKDVPFYFYKNSGIFQKGKDEPFVYDGESIFNNKKDEVVEPLLHDMLFGNLVAKPYPANFVGKTFSPSHGKKYYYVGYKGRILFGYYISSSFDLALKFIGNIFETEKIAKANVESILDKCKGAIDILLSKMLLHNPTAKPVNLVGMTFSPNHKDKYYYVSPEGKVYHTYCAEDNFGDLALKLMENMFETEEIAKANIDSIVAKYKEVM